jgi:hypothetical protein
MNNRDHPKQDAKQDCRRKGRTVVPIGIGVGDGIALELRHEEEVEELCGNGAANCNG